MFIEQQTKTMTEYTLHFIKLNFVKEQKCIAFVMIMLKSTLKITIKKKHMYFNINDFSTIFLLLLKLNFNDLF